MKNDKANRAMQHLDDELIVSAMSDDELGLTPKTTFERKSLLMKKTMWKKWVALAAAFVIIFSAAIFAIQLGGGGDSAIIALDVNPSIELEVNDKEKVVEVRALNDDAKKVIGEMDLYNFGLEESINAIIGSMLKHGYLSTDQNSILISINSENEARAATLRDKLTDEISTLLGNQNIDASVMTQSFDKNDEMNKKADENNISPAKATLISKIVAAELLDANGVPYTYETLAQLKVNELKLILDQRPVRVAGVDFSGNASDGKYIAKDAAIAKALEKAGLEPSEAKRIEVEFDFDDDIRAMVYEVEFRAADKKYEYEINATTGDILEEEIKPDSKVNDKDDDDDDVTAPAESITRAAALEIAYTDAGVTANEVKRPEIELDREKGVIVYEIEFKVSGKEYEYKINALTGEIIDREVEKDD